MTNEPEKEKPPAKEEMKFLEGSADYRGKDFLITDNPELKNVRFEICSRPDILGIDKKWYVIAHGGLFGMHNYNFISNMIPIGTSGQYQIGYKGEKYSMHIFEEVESQTPPVIQKMRIEIKEVK